MVVIFSVIVEVKTFIREFNRRKQNEDHNKLIFFLTGKIDLQTQLIYKQNWNLIYLFSLSLPLEIKAVWF